MRRPRAAALACALLLSMSAVGALGAAAAAAPADAPGGAKTLPGRPRKPANPNAKTEPMTSALANQSDLSSFRALLKFIGADDELAAATDADLVVFAPTNAALDAFAKQVTGSTKATAKDLLQEKYLALLAHVAQAHVTEDDDDDGVYDTLGGQSLLVTDPDGDGDDDDSSKVPGKSNEPPRVTVLPSKKTTATILREDDLGDAGDLYVVDRVLVPDDTYATPAEAFKADPELATYGRLLKALAPELVARIDAGAPGTLFVPTSAALNKYLASAGLTEAKLLTASPEVKAKATGTLVYHVAPGVGLDRDSLEEGGLTLNTALVVGPEPKQGQKIGPADVVKTVKVSSSSSSSSKDGKGALVVQGDLSKATVGSQVFAGADVLYKVDNVLLPSESAGAAPKKPAGPTASTGRKLLRAATRNNIIANTQRANIRRAMNGSISVAQATRANSAVASLAPMNRVPNYFLTSGGTRGGFLV